MFCLISIRCSSCISRNFKDDCRFCYVDANRGWDFEVKAFCYVLSKRQSVGAGMHSPVKCDERMSAVAVAGCNSKWPMRRSLQNQKRRRNLKKKKNVRQKRNRQSDPHWRNDQRNATDDCTLKQFSPVIREGWETNMKTQLCWKWKVVSRNVTAGSMLASIAFMYTRYVVVHVKRKY